METYTQLRSRRSLILAAAGAPLVMAFAHSALAQQPVPPGTQVVLQFQQEISTRNAKKGDLIPLKVYSNVVVDGKTLIRQDAAATGIVTDVSKPGRFGKRGKLKIRLESVKDVSGNRVMLEQYSSGERFKAEGPGAAAGGLLVLGPVGLVGGAFIKGSHVTIEKGTRIQAQVAGPKKDEDAAKTGDKNDSERADKVERNPPVDWPDRNIPGQAP